MRWLLCSLIVVSKVVLARRYDEAISDASHQRLLRFARNDKLEIASLGNDKPRRCEPVWAERSVTRCQLPVARLGAWEGC